MDNYRFVDRCLSFCSFPFGLCVVCSSIYEFWLPLWYLQTLLMDVKDPFNFEQYYTIWNFFKANIWHNWERQECISKSSIAWDVWFFGEHNANSFLLCLAWFPIDNHIFFSAKKSEGVGSSAGSANNCLFFCPPGNQHSGNTGNTNGQTGAGTGTSTGIGKYCMGILSYAKNPKMQIKGI